MLTWSLELIGGRRLVLQGELNGGNGQLRLVGSNGSEVLVPVVEHGHHAKASIELEGLDAGTWRVEGTKLTADARVGPPFVLTDEGVPKRVRLRADTKGRLGLDVVTLDRHAEARRLRIDGDLLELELSHEGTVVARPRGESAREVAGDGPRLDLSTLARRGSGDETWRLWLSTPTGEQLRIARHFDGVPGKRRLAALPTVQLADRVVRLRYTDDDQLAVSCEPRHRTLPMRRPESATLRRRALGGPAIVLHWLAIALVRRLPAPRDAPARESAPRVRFVLANAFGMGGTIRATFNLAGELAASRSVDIISVRRHQPRPFFAIPDEVGLRSLDDLTARRGPLKRVLAAIPSVLVHPEDHAYVGSSLLTDVLLVRALRRSGGDIIVTTRPAYALIAAAVAPPSAKLIAQEHLHLEAHRKRLGRALRRAYRKVDALTVLTEADRAAYASQLPGTRVVRVPSVRVPPGAAVADTSAPVLVAAGRLTPQKGFDLLIRAFAPVARRHEDWQLRIYGGGRDRDALRDLIVAEGLHDQVFLMGATRDLGDALAEGGLFALSSRFEGFGMVVVEAMSRGLPVVSFACPHGPAEAITHGRDGLLVPPEDVGALSAAIEELVADPERRARMGAAALEAARAYEPAGVAAEWAALLAEL